MVPKSLLKALKEDPQEISIPAPPEREEIATIDSLIPDRKARLEMTRLINVLGDIKAQKSLLAKTDKDLVSKVKRLAGKYGVGKAICGEYTVSYFNQPRTSVSVDMLLAMGVEASKIAAATVTKDSYTLKVYKGKKEETEEGGEDQ